MVWYKYKDEYPTNGLPSRIRIKDNLDSGINGLTRTSLYEYSSDELETLGFSIVYDPPFYDIYTQDLIWNNNTYSWSISTTTDPIKISSAWEKNIYFKDQLKIKLYELANLYVESGGTLSTYFSNAINILDNITESNYDNPFNFNWQHPSLVGYTEEVVVGVGSDEYRLVNQAFVNFVSNVYIPNQEVK